MQQKWHCCGCRKQADLVCCRKDELHTRLSPQWRGGVDPELALGHLSDHSWHIWAWEAEAGYDPSCCSMKQLVLWLCPGSPQSRHMLEIPSQPWSPLPGNETWDIESQQAFLSPSQVLAVLSWAVFTDFTMARLSVRLREETMSPRVCLVLREGRYQMGNQSVLVPVVQERGMWTRLDPGVQRYCRPLLLPLILPFPGEQLNPTASFGGCFS